MDVNDSKFLIQAVKFLRKLLYMNPVNVQLPYMFGNNFFSINDQVRSTRTEYLGSWLVITRYFFSYLDCPNEDFKVYLITSGRSRVQTAMFECATTTSCVVLSISPTVINLLKHSALSNIGSIYSVVKSFRSVHEMQTHSPFWFQSLPSHNQTRSELL